MVFSFLGPCALRPSSSAKKRLSTPPGGGARKFSSRWRRAGRPLLVIFLFFAAASLSLRPMEESGETDLSFITSQRQSEASYWWDAARSAVSCCLRPLGGSSPFAFLNPTGEKNPRWSCFLFTELPRIVIPLIGAVQLPGKVSGGRNLIPGPERAPLPPQSSTIALNNGLFFCSSTLRNICGYHPFSNC